uniref:Uncharacterized protein n=1 Tax=Entomoneis paludosa TaxID=265537 RepID=A0A7S2Y646_9STRA
MAPLREEIRTVLRQLLAEHESEETAVEIMRLAAQESGLLQETEKVKDALRSDPFECLKEMKTTSKDRLLELLQVTDCHRVHTRDGYCHISVTLQFNADMKMKSKGVSSFVELQFNYERQGDSTFGGKSDSQQSNPSVSYTIDLSRDHGPKEKLMWVEMFVSGLTPSRSVPAINMECEDEDDSDGWEDMSEDGEEEPASGRKRGPEALIEAKEPQRYRSNNVVEPQPGETKEEFAIRMSEKIGTPHPDQEPDEEDVDMENTPHRYSAGIDPDALSRFLQWTNIGSEMPDELASTYLLFTFPFFEPEFDLIDYILDSVFGSNEEEDDD